MIERSVVALYATAGGIALAFYLGAYRHGAERIARDVSAIKRHEVVIADERRLLAEASALRTLQDRVRQAMRSPLQAGSSGNAQADFFERLHVIARQEKIVLTTIVQSAATPSTPGTLLATVPMKLTVVGTLAGVMRFLSAIDESVGLVDFGRIEIHPEATSEGDASAVAVRIDGTFLEVQTPKRLGDR